jgi:hypothetical protein
MKAFLFALVVAASSRHPASNGLRLRREGDAATKCRGRQLASIPKSPE